VIRYATGLPYPTKLFFANISYKTGKILMNINAPLQNKLKDIFKLTTFLMLLNDGQTIYFLETHSIRPNVNPAAKRLKANTSSKFRF
jgi:hypothetical protein